MRDDILATGWNGFGECRSEGRAGVIRGMPPPSHAPFQWTIHSVYGDLMATREEFLRQVWVELINSNMQGLWIDNVLREAEKNPTGPFADLGPRSSGC